jgi:two-component system chemotaxis response regulator CheY
MINLSTLRVLVIDDVEVIRNLLFEDLKELGISDIQMSDSPHDSWKLMNDLHSEGKPIDLILCDWNMPKGDGIDFLTKIRSGENSDLRLTKFIMITGSENKVKQAIDKGANNIRHKPFSTKTLKEKLELIFRPVN